MQCDEPVLGERLLKERALSRTSVARDDRLNARVGAYTFRQNFTPLDMEQSSGTGIFTSSFDEPPREILHLALR
jgi:hypothetical protein